MSKDYQLERMTNEGLARIFPKMKQDFGHGELKPEASLRKQMASGLEDAWFLLADGQEAGYAFVITHPSIPIALLDYIATYHRSQGNGSAFLALLKEKYPQGLMAEVEAEVPGDDEEENELRRRRFAFYQRSEFRPYPFDNKIFGVNYLVHAWQPETAAYHMHPAEALSKFYEIQMPKATCRMFVHITVPDEA